MDSSTSSSNPQREKYDVFISFRGADVRNRFLSHLLVALEKEQIKVFMDDNDLERGKPIAPTLLKTIEESSISIVIFSKDYPSSEWCLDELQKIHECMQSNKHIVVPIFYHVDPSIVQDLQQDYALTMHAGEAPDAKNENWKCALKEISNLAGFDSANPKNRSEAKLCDEIANDIGKKLSGMYESYSLTYGLFDIDSRIKEVESLIEKEENNVSMVGIWGMGGIGKTTLVDKVFNRIKNNFDGRYCFVRNVKDKLSTKWDPNHLRDEIIWELLGDKKKRLRIGSPHTIDDSIQKRLKDKKVLIVLDDVDDCMQLNSLLNDSGFYSPGIFCPGSRIIVTSRDRQVLENVKMKKHVYEVKLLKHCQALQLFSWHAFDQYSPQQEYKELSEEVVKYAQGLPLALKVLGSELKGKSTGIWVDKLKKIKDIPPGSIQNILTTSFDGLDRVEKRIFLDIACFFKGHDIQDVKRILSCFDFYSIDGIERLCDKSLITILEFGGHRNFLGIRDFLEIHDLLEQMGREIVVNESGQNCEKQSRLWKCVDIENVLRTNKGTENVECISIDVRELDHHLDIDSKAFINMNKLRFLRVFPGPYNFKRPKNKVFLPDGLEFLPNSLRYLQWEYFPLCSLPSHISLEKLVELHMRGSNLKELVWDKPPQHLKCIRLSYSWDLMKISGLDKAPNLEVIELNNCPRLVEIGSSLEKLNNLIELDLRWSTSLYRLPEIPCSTKRLYLNRIYGYPGLDISHFPNLTSFPNTFFNLRSLQPLEELNASCSGLKELPFSIGKLKYLNSLNISNCESLNKLPENLGNLESLEELDASGSSLEELPSSIKHLCKLRFLYLSYCRKLRYLPDLPQNLEKLSAANCVFLESLSACFKFPRDFLDLTNCYKLNDGASSTIRQHLREYLSTYKCTDLCIVGREVPQWMKYRSSDSFLCFEFDTHGRTICFIFCAAIVAVDYGVEASLIEKCGLGVEVSLIDECGNKIVESFPTMIGMHKNIDHVILGHGWADYNVRGAAFRILKTCGVEDCIIIKSIGVHPIVESSGDELDERPRTMDLVSLSRVTERENVMRIRQRKPYSYWDPDL